MKDDWVEISFGIEDIDDYPRWIYEDKGGYTDSGGMYGRNKALLSGQYGEVISRDACQEASKENRIFFYRIRYEPK